MPATPRSFGDLARDRPRRLARSVPVATVILVAVACGGSASEPTAPAGAPDAPSPATPSATASGSAPPSTPSPRISGDPTPQVLSERVRFDSTDGELLVGRLFGEVGQRGVVLAHQIDDDQSDWFDFAQVLAARGYTVLTFNFQGTCGGGGCSRGGAPTAERWLDVVGAVRFLETRDVSRIALVGASLGGEASIAAAARLGDRISALVTVSASMGLVEVGPGAARRDAASITVPKLFVAGKDDVAFADAARAYAGVAPEPVRLELLPFGDHGVDLLRWEAAATTEPLVFSFLDRAMRV